MIDLSLFAEIALTNIVFFPFFYKLSYIFCYCVEIVFLKTMIYVTGLVFTFLPRIKFISIYLFIRGFAIICVTTNISNVKTIDETLALVIIKVVLFSFLKYFLLSESTPEVHLGVSYVKDYLFVTICLCIFGR